jgi:arylsulfatase A-like enzyme
VQCCDAVLALATLSLVILGCRDAPPGLPPNVILILVDTLRADHLSSYGYPRQTSPRLDAFAADNIRFERVRSQAACTSPSVSSLFTSRSPLVLMDQPAGHLGVPPGLPGLAEILKDYGYWTIAVSSSPIVRKSPSDANRFGEFDRGFDLFDEECLMEDARCVNRKALELIDTITPPFFLYLHYMDVHAPYAPPDDFERPFSQPYSGHEMVRAGRPQQFQQVARKRGRKIQTGEVRHFVDRYDDEIAFLDLEFGRLIDALSERELVEESIVVVASDHGDAFMEQGYLGHCRSPLFEGMLSTPLLMAIPGVERDEPVRADVQNLDIVPTLVDYLGRDPDDYAFEGRSLRGLIDGSDGASRIGFAVQGVELAVSDRDYTLTYDLDSQTTRIFERSRDPEHKSDLASRPPAASEALRDELERQISLAPGSSEKAAAEGARRLEAELRALGYLLEPEP